MSDFVELSAIIVYGLLCVVPALLVALYYGFLMVARLCGAVDRVQATSDAIHRFAIVIPAHDEEQTIAEVLQSCASLDYPADKYQVFVIADNCTDRTAEIARRYGVTCLERQDALQRGKGHALEWGFSHVLQGNHDVVVVLDADCLIDRHALRAFDHCLKEGSRVLQANYVLSNPDASPISYAARVGNVLEYDFFYSPKSFCGLAVMLVGTGMVFRRDVLETVPWCCHSLTEDAEYTIQLANRGIRVRFVENVQVIQAGADNIQQLQVQRSRWAGGTLELGRRSAAWLIVKGIMTGKILLADAGWTLLVVTRPLVLLHLALTAAIGFLLSIWQPSPLSQAMSVIAFGIVAMYAVYLGVGVQAAGLNARRMCYLVAAPVILTMMAGIAVKASLANRTVWVRTPREQPSVSGPR